MDESIRARTDEDRSDAWNKGYSAAGFGADKSVNPYNVGTQDNADWDAGYAQWIKDNPKG